jgi:UDP-GlcNAc:undecaprenyl-phosphate GlcNAc-1-phosphate transferase
LRRPAIETEPAAPGICKKVKKNVILPEGITLFNSEQSNAVRIFWRKIMDIAARFVLALAISFASTPIITRFASKNGVVDKPGGRKAHQEPKPLLGGLSIFLACGVAGLIYYSYSFKALTLLACGLLILVLGVVDDIYNINPFYKLAGQLIAAALLVGLNSGSYRVLVENLARFQVPGFVTLALIAGWIVLMTNAFNLIDGLDGLATGTAMIIAGAMAVSASLGGHSSALGSLLIVLGACLGFFPYNFSPARIFLGDAGSMLLGFFLASMHLFFIAAPLSLSLVLSSAFLFAYPALDVTYAIYRRLRNKGSLFSGDQGHIHHILLRLGLRVRTVVLLLYLGSAAFAALAVFLMSMKVSAGWVAFLGVAALAGVAALFYRLTRLSAGALRRGFSQR